MDGRKIESDAGRAGIAPGKRTLCAVRGTGRHSTSASRSGAGRPTECVYLQSASNVGSLGWISVVPGENFSDGGASVGRPGLARAANAAGHPPGGVQETTENRPPHQSAQPPVRQRDNDMAHVAAWGGRWRTTRTTRGGVAQRGLTHTETRRGRGWTTRMRGGVGSKDRKTTPATTSTTPSAPLP